MKSAPHLMALLSLFVVIATPSFSQAAWQFGGRSGMSAAYCPDDVKGLHAYLDDTGDADPAVIVSHVTGTCIVQEGTVPITYHPTTSSMDCEDTGPEGGYYTCTIQFRNPTYAGDSTLLTVYYWWDVLGEDPTEEGPGEPTCGDKAGQEFTMPDYIYNANGPGYSQTTQANGWLYGCNIQVLSCSNGACRACFTGDGTANTDMENPIRWNGIATLGGSSTCNVSETPTGHPGFCSTTDPTYDATTDSCGLETTPINCDDPAYDGVSACTWTFPDPETTEPTYTPPGSPASTVPPITPPQFEAPPPAPPPSPTPPVNTGNDPGYTGGGENNPDGGIGYNPGGVPQVTGGTGSSGGSGESSTDDDGTASWGNLPAFDADGFYDRQYEGGIAAVFADRMAEMQQTPIFGFANQFAITNGIGVPPTFTLDMTAIGMGTFEFGFFQNDTIWTLMRWLVLIATFFFCRRIIFGV